MNQILHSTILGKGEPLLILHGFLGMSDNWKTLGKKYAESGFEVHLIDQRNHGRSFHSETFNYETLAEDVKNYMLHHNIESANLIGHSMGGKTVMQLAVTIPNKVLRLVVADIAPKYYPPHHQAIINALTQLDFSVLKSRGDADKELAFYLNDFGIRQFLLKNLYWKEKGMLALRVNLEVLQHKMEEIGEPIGGTDLYEGPTLFLKGSRSEYVQENDTPHIKQHFPNVTIKTIENAGHWLHAENPEQFFETSLEFLKC